MVILLFVCLHNGPCVPLCCDDSHSPNVSKAHAHAHTTHTSIRICTEHAYHCAHITHPPALTHAHMYLYLYYHCQSWLCSPYLGGEPAGGNKTGGPVGSGDTSLIFLVAWPFTPCTPCTHTYTQSCTTTFSHAHTLSTPCTCSGMDAVCFLQEW